MSASRKPGSDILHVAATLCRYGLDPMSGRVSAREYERLHELQVGFGVLLRRDLDALRAEVARLETERDRLANISHAVERDLLLRLWREIEGDQEGEPPGVRVLEANLVAAVRGRDEEAAEVVAERDRLTDELNDTQVDLQETLGLLSDVVTMDDCLREVRAVKAERDRLARVLAVERGNATAAPDGWRGSHGNYWYRDNKDGTGLSCVVGWTGRGRYRWAVYRDGKLVADGVAATALEAMEAANAAAGEPTP